MAISNQLIDIIMIHDVMFLAETVEYIYIYILNA